MVRRLRSLIPSLGAMFYAVRRGKRCGIFGTWEECKEQVYGYKDAQYKKFKAKAEALEFLQGNVSVKKVKTKAIVSHSDKGKKLARLSDPLVGHPEDHGGTSTDASIPVVHTDGGCFANGQSMATAGIGVYWGESDPRNVSERLDGIQTNQRAELNAAIKALEVAKKENYKDIEIRTDSKYTIDCADKWISAWKKNGWKTASGQNVKNQVDIRRLDDLCQQIKVNWVHVKAHSGIFGNEQADRLAKNGALKDLPDPVKR